MLRCYTKNNIDTTVGVRRIRAVEVPDYPALKTHLKQRFPQYFGGLILDFSANIDREYVTDCIRDTFEFFEATNVAWTTRSALIGIGVGRYRKDLEKLGLISRAKMPKFKRDAGFQYYEALENGYTISQIMDMYRIKPPAMKRYYSVWRKKGISANKSDEKYIKIYQQWKEKRNEQPNSGVLCHSKTI